MGNKFSIHHPPKKSDKVVRPPVVIAWGDFDARVVSKDMIRGLLLPVYVDPPVGIVGNTHVVNLDLWVVAFWGVQVGEYVLEIWKLNSDGSGRRDKILCRRRIQVRGAFGITMSAPVQGATVYSGFTAGGSDDTYQPVTCWFTYDAQPGPGAQSVLGTPVHDGSAAEPYWLQSFSILVQNDTQPTCVCSATNALQPRPAQLPTPLPAAQVHNDQITLKGSTAQSGTDGPGDDS